MSILDIFDDMSAFLREGTIIKPQATYLDLKKGNIPLKVGFSSHPHPDQGLPTLKTIQPGEKIWPSFSEFIQMDGKIEDTLEINSPYWNLKDTSAIDSLICDNIVEESIRKGSMKLFDNKKNEIPRIKQQISEIVQEGTVDAQNFSANCITNSLEYDLQGNPLKITNHMIPPQSKNYVEVQKDELLIYNNLPHPIRQKASRMKSRADCINKKSPKQIEDEFQILYAQFDSNNVLSSGENNNTLNEEGAKKILDAVHLVDYSYQDLWEKIVGEIRLTNKDSANFKQKNNKLTMGDEDFQKAIDRILTQAIEYEKEAFDIEQEEEQQVEAQKDNEEEVGMEKMENDKKEEKDKNADTFANLKIEKKGLSQGTNSSKYQYAIEDERDLTNFYDMLPKQKFAHKYDFELDEFQKRSILHLQNKESVFVAAHTSAGKTAVAEYGIALAINNKRKVIYTSPIKALSNQKYRQLSKKFGNQNVGIITGDVSMNQQANCVIMTTQILRNNLYRGAEMIKDIEWVIFDEVHYINNEERGVVWEETIILLPQHIGIIMLSATVPNYMDFANWVGRTKHRIIYVIKTLHRPVPLEHSLYIFNKFHVIKQANGRFLREEYKDLHLQIRTMGKNKEDVDKALKEQKKKKIEEKGFYNDNRKEQRIKLMTKNAIDKFIKNISRSDMETAEGRQEHRILQELITDCKKKNLLPCVIFTFSKKKINALADKIYGFDLTTHSEKSRIHRRIMSALSNLKPEDQEISQFQFLYKICINGYAVHHGDLLPIAKQIVELLFSDGLIKVLFATETFAMGINMPTKTVIFNAIKKVKDSSGLHRFLNSSEYVQMSGRAGRRGLDQKGTVIIVVKDPSSLPEANEMQQMVDHPGERLSSKFKVTYQIILNLLNSVNLGVTEMLRQSFLENPKFSEFTSNVKQIKHFKSEYKQLSEFDCQFNKLRTRILIEEYMAASKKLKIENEESFKIAIAKGFMKHLPKYAKILGHNNETRVGMILKFDPVQGRKSIYDRSVLVMIVNKIYTELQLNKEERLAQEKRLGIKKKIVLEYDEDRATNKNDKFLEGEVPGRNHEYRYLVKWVSPNLIIETYGNKINTKCNLDDKNAYSQLSEYLVTLPKKLTPNADDSELKAQFLQEFEESPCHNCELKEKHTNQYHRRLEVKDRISHCANKIDTNQLGLMGSFEGMLLVLNYFNFISESTKNDETFHSLTLKGKVAKEVDIYVAEIVVEAILDPLDPAQIAALLSAFVCDYKPRPMKGQTDESMVPIPKDTIFTSPLTKAIGKTMKIINKITEEEQSMAAFTNLNASSMEEHIMSIANFHLTDTVYKWAIGFDFSEAKEDTRAPEGTIVRTIMRLSQLMSNVKSVCRIIGNNELEQKIDRGLQAIKRDIVFCQSLYLTN